MFFPFELISWWFLLAVITFFFMVTHFGFISRGNKQLYIQAAGTLGLIVSVILSVILFGWKTFLGLLLLLTIIVYPVIGFFMAWIYDQLYGERDRRAAKQLGITERAARNSYYKVRDMRPEEEIN